MGSYVYNMRIDISVPDEIAEQLKQDSIKKYGNLRSVSKLITDLVMESRPQDIAAIKTERLGWIAEIIIKDDLATKKGTICSLAIPILRCQNCDAEFSVIIRSDAKYCPACRGSDLKPITDGNDIEKRIRDVVYKDL